jgi:hypothetical protein
LEEALPFVLAAFGTSSSSSVKSSEEAFERCEAEEREDEDLTDFVSTSESEGTMKSSSSDALERDFRAIHI